jgi:hypothetical protein
MEINKLSISQLIRIGFFVGIGASIPITIISYIPMLFIDDFMMMEFEDEFAEFEEDYIEFSPVESKLEAKIGKNHKIENGWVFLGTLTNNGEDSWDNATVQIELFDEAGDFLDESDGYIQGAITPGTTHNFKVTFHSCHEERDMVFSDFKIAVTGAY